MILLCICGALYVKMELAVVRLKNEATAVYDYILEETYYMDESKGIELTESVSAGYSIKFSNEKGVNTHLTLIKDFNRYDIIYTDEATKVEVYDVTVKYQVGFIYEEVTEPYYKVYINKNYLYEGGSEE